MPNLPQWFTAINDPLHPAYPPQVIVTEGAPRPTNNTGSGGNTGGGGTTPSSEDYSTSVVVTSTDSRWRVFPNYVAITLSVPNFEITHVTVLDTATREEIEPINIKLVSPNAIIELIAKDNFTFILDYGLLP